MSDKKLSHIEVRGVSGLDEIDVYFLDVRPGAGHVTITCFGSAWTAYFGAMAGKTIAQFVARVEVDYLVTKLGITPQLKGRKCDNAYLARIVRAVQAELQPKKTPDDPCFCEHQWASHKETGGCEFCKCTIVNPKFWKATQTPPGRAEESPAKTEGHTEAK